MGAFAGYHTFSHLSEAFFELIRSSESIFPEQFRIGAKYRFIPYVQLLLLTDVRISGNPIQFMVVIVHSISHLKVWGENIITVGYTFIDRIGIGVIALHLRRTEIDHLPWQVHQELKRGAQIFFCFETRFSNQIKVAIESWIDNFLWCFNNAPQWRGTIIGFFQNTLTAWLNAHSDTGATTLF